MDPIAQLRFTPTMPSQNSQRRATAQQQPPQNSAEPLQVKIKMVELTADLIPGAALCLSEARDDNTFHKALDISAEEFLPCAERIMAKCVEAKARGCIVAVAESDPLDVVGVVMACDLLNWEPMVSEAIYDAPESIHIWATYMSECKRELLQKFPELFRDLAHGQIAYSFFGAVSEAYRGNGLLRSLSLVASASVVRAGFSAQVGIPTHPVTVRSAERLPLSVRKTFADFVYTDGSRPLSSVNDPHHSITFLAPMTSKRAAELATIMALASGADENGAKAAAATAIKIFNSLLSKFFPTDPELTRTITFQPNWKNQKHQQCQQLETPTTEEHKSKPQQLDLKNEQSTQHANKHRQQQHTNSPVKQNRVQDSGFMAGRSARIWGFEI